MKKGVDSSFAAALPLLAQQRVDLRQTHERLLCVLPMIGSGTWDDPRRPLFAPTRNASPLDRSGMLAFTFQPSDDGRFALVEIVARDRAALREILSSTRADVKAF